MEAILTMDLKKPPVPPQVRLCTLCGNSGPLKTVPDGFVFDGPGGRTTVQPDWLVCETPCTPRRI